jgi:hypothetical protein
MSESNGVQAVGFIEWVRRSAIWAGKIAVVLFLINIAMSPVMNKLSEADPCSQSGLRRTVEATMVVFLIAAVLLGLFSVLAGLVTLRGRAIAYGLLSFLVLYILIAVTFPSHVTRRKDVFAVAQLRTINTAEVMYRVNASKFGSIEDLIRAGLLDSRFTSAVDGYNFTVISDKNEFTARATSASRYGCWDYFTSTDAKIRYSTEQSRAPKGQSAQIAE